jgi:hypothetical protein
MKEAKWLVEAFKEDPLFQFMFNGRTHETEAFFTFLIQKAEALHEWVVIEEKEGSPVAIAFVETPKSLSGFSVFMSFAFWKVCIRLLRRVRFSTFGKRKFMHKLMQILQQLGFLLVTKQVTNIRNRELIRNK